MLYLLDSNVWIDYLKGVATELRSRVRSTPASEIVVCSIVRAELLHGALKYGEPDRRRRLVLTTLRPYRSLAFDDESATVYGTVRRRLEIAGETMGSNDLMIAAIALRWGLTLVTNDAAFDRVEGLSIENWRTA